MALGKFHNFTNYFFFLILLGAISYFDLTLFQIIFFILGFLFSTFIFSPDTDIRIKSEIPVIGLLFYPYMKLFKHRGISHHFLWGTLTRIIYLGIIFYLFLCLYLLIKYQFSFSAINLIYQEFKLKMGLLFSFSQFLFFFFIGMYIADLIHITTDFISSFLKKL